ncbi:MAG: DUF1491 family protein [Hyphomicrobiales bacterium]
MRLSSEFWVSAYIRQCQSDGDFAALSKRGVSHGGAVFVLINRLDGTNDLYGPAPQSLLDGSHDVNERVFYKLISQGSQEDLDTQLGKEQRFDTDLWVVERESRTGEHGLMVVS